VSFAPKQYQRRALEAWHAFCERHAAGVGAAEAFAAVTADTWGRALPYVPPPCLGTAPAVCLRIPTGGGKTYIAAAACGIAASAGLLGGAGRETVVVWLVPSTAIAEQTLLALRDPRHACHRALVEGAGGFPGVGPVRVLDDQEALSLAVADVRSGAVVIVATIQSFKTEQTDQRVVYRQNGQLMDHGLADPSLAAVLAAYRPLIVVDEAHNARSDASFDALGRLGPALVLEITATPIRTGGARLPSNVLVSASAHELHAEQMLKLPLELAVNADPDQCLGLAVRRRAELARLAELETAGGAPYLRPILLVQAQAKKAGTETMTPEVVKRKLIEDHGVAEAAIRIATGSVRELDDIDRDYARGLEDPHCPVTVIITVEALREGWDCPWAYVLCTLKGSFTDTAATQIVGRVLRQPGARLRQTPALNRAYAVAVASGFAEAMGNLVRVLTDLGYEREAAATFAVASAEIQDGIALPLPTPVATSAGTALIPARVAALPDSLRDRVTVHLDTGTISVASHLSEDERRVVIGCIADAPTAVAFNHALRTACDRAAAAAQELFPAEPTCAAERGVPFLVPQLLVQRQDAWWPIDDTILNDRAWTLDPVAALLDAAAYVPRRPRFDRADIDIDRAGRITYRVREGEEAPIIAVDDPPEGRLTWWLADRIQTGDISFDDLQGWILAAIRHLVTTRGIALSELEADQWHLKSVLEQRIAGLRLRARREATQSLLFDAETRDGLRPSSRDRHFRFDPTRYPAGDLETTVRFSKHYYQVVGRFDTEEERACATTLDALPEVSTWVRNLVRREPDSFRLPRAPSEKGSWFYPDFVALLRDGRTMVVEYKGADRADSQDTRDKVAAGGLWARTTGGLFVLVADRDYDAIRRAIASQPPGMGTHPSWPPGYWEAVRRDGPVSDLGEVPPLGGGLSDIDPADWGRPG
jgi:type III restriction enzyme